MNRAGQGAKGRGTQGSLTTPLSTTSSTATVTSSQASTAAHSPAPTGTPTPAPSPTTQPVAFSVTGVSASASPSNYHGVCNSTMTFTFSATFSVPARTSGGTVTYHWFRSDGATGTTQTVGFSPGATTRTVTTTWDLGSVRGNGSPFWEAVQVTAPNSTTSTHATFSFVCQSSSPKVTSISAVVSPGSYDCSQSQVTFNFTATIYLSDSPGGVNITYTWTRSDGATMSPITTSVPAGQTTVTVTETWTLGVGAPAGSYWEQVHVTGPNSITSNKATFTKPC